MLFRFVYAIRLPIIRQGRRYMMKPRRLLRHDADIRYVTMLHTP